LTGFEIIPIEAVRGQIEGMGAGVRGWRPLLGEGIRGSVRLGRIGMISKSAKKRRDPYSTPVPFLGVSAYSHGFDGDGKVYLHL
jgi:hypothetical protein